MKRLTILRLSIPLYTLLVLAGCGEEQGAVEEEHVHGGIAVTIWTNATELFFEYSPMVVGVPSDPWAIHVTRLEDFSPVTEGVLTLNFRKSDGMVYTTKSEVPVRPGIYAPAPQLPSQGTYRLEMVMEGPQLFDRIEVGEFVVYATEGDVPHEDEPANEEGITFLKEQQWPIEFSVTAAEMRELPQTIAVSGEIIPAAGRVAEVAAPVSGLTVAQENLSAPVPGDRVRAGQTLAVLSPTTKDNSFAQAKANVQRLERETARLARLFEVEAVPEKRLVETRQDLEVAQASFAAMGVANDDGYNYGVQSPLSGVVQDRRFTPGGFVEAGQSLFVIVNSSVVWLRLNVPARYASFADAAVEAAFTVEGIDRRYRTGRVISVGGTIDPDSRTLPLILAVNNADGSLKYGMFAQAQLGIGGTRSGVSIPAEAVQNEDGQPVAYVQIGGEKFERRVLVLGPTDGAFTIVERGISVGEHAITKGAYDVYLSSLNTNEIGDHGHAH